jgi:hypothetical protein
MKRILVVPFVAVAVLGLAGCKGEAKDVNKNLAKDADNFQIAREVTAYNGITDKVILSVSGLCSVDNGDPSRYSITCKIGTGKNARYTRDLVGKSDNVTVVTHQLEATNASTSAYRFVIRPDSLIPDVDIHTK